jgi:diguanylate cyclase (GGDEF)-like protein/putative nucleotidyltransferase with HDIG domain
LSRLPLSAKAYLVFVCVLGFVAILLSQELAFPPSAAKPWELFIFIVLAVMAGGKKVTLSKKLINEEAGSMSLGFAITFAALLKFGPGPAVFIGAASCLSSCLFPARQAWHQLLFNVALGALEALVGGFVFVALNGWTLQVRPAETFMAVTATSLTFYGVNTLGVATIIGLCTRSNLLKVWKENFLWTAPSYFASASVSALAILVFKSSVTGVLLFVAPVAYLIYQSYSTYIGRAEEKQQHIEELQVSQAHLAELYLATIKSLALAIDAKDQYTHQHILRVQRYAVAIALEMGLSGAELEAVNTGALLHDIGKLGVPEYVLLKPGRLTAEEFEKIKKHPEIGAAILDPVEFPWPVLPVVRHHHEKWDGTGYPDGLKGEEIPLTARIMAVADVYDALTSSRSYRRAWTHQRAVETIVRDAGSHFDAVVVESFIKVIDRVVAEMAEEGQGPLVVSDGAPKESDSKAAQAALQISRSSAELWALYEVAQTLSASLSTEDTMQILTRKLELIFPGVLCAFLLYDKETGRLQVGSVAGPNAVYFASAHTISAVSLSSRVLKDGSSYSGEYDPDDLMLSSNEGAAWTELRAAMVVPLIFEGQPLGTINMYSAEEAQFSSYDQQLLEMIAERAAPALYNGLLFDRARGDASRDPVTGLFNVRYLTELLEAKCSVAQDPFSILCLDLDSFKPINDNFGHQKGDSVLQDFANILSRVAGPDDVVARYGGDEFVLVLSGAGKEQAACTAETLRKAVEDYDPHLVHFRLGSLKIGVSIGAATFPEDGGDCSSLISAADADMYRQKTERKLTALAVKAEDSRAA